VAEALACEEIERGEAAFRTLISVHVGSTRCRSSRYGTEEQRQRYPSCRRRRARKLGCFRADRAGPRLRRRRDALRRRAGGRHHRPERTEELDLVRDRG
jgi:alkylation response protein AidB-like acyl-CoA dehydrogenase